jgi:regulator of replication initiation timing
MNMTLDPEVLSGMVLRHESAIISLTAEVAAMRPEPVDWNGGRKAVDALEEAHGVEVNNENFAKIERLASDIAAKDAALSKRHLQVKEMHQEIATLRAEVAALRALLKEACEDHMRDDHDEEHHNRYTREFRDKCRAAGVEVTP